jgi:hypothetical protein
MTREQMLDQLARKFYAENEELIVSLVKESFTAYLDRMSKVLKDAN